jgi:hypothetical protein
MLASLAEAQQVSDARVADLVQAGKIRVGVHSVMYTRDPQTGEPKGAPVQSPNRSRSPIRGSPISCALAKFGSEYTPLHKGSSNG